MPVDLIPVCSKYPWIGCRFFFFPSWFQIYFCIPYIFLGHPINPFFFASGRRSGILLHNLNCENFTTFYNIFVNGTLYTPFVIVGIVRQKGKTWFKSFQNQLKPYFSSLIFFPFSLKLSKNTWDPREVIVWKFEGPTSNGLVATALFYNPHTKLVKLVDRYIIENH